MGPVAQLLVERGAWPTEQYNAKILTEAVSAGNVGEVKRLLRRRGVRANCEWDESSPLEEAVRTGHIGITKLLLEMGAKPDKANGEYGWTPFDLAARKGDEHLIELLRDCLEKREANRHSGRQKDKRRESDSDEEEEDEEEDEFDSEEDEFDSEEDEFGFDSYSYYDDYISNSDLGKGKVQSSVLEYFVRSVQFASDLDKDSPLCFDLGRQKQTLITKYFVKSIQFASGLDTSPSCFDLGRQKQTLITKYFVRSNLPRGVPASVN